MTGDSRIIHCYHQEWHMSYVIYWLSISPSYVLLKGCTHPAIQSSPIESWWPAISLYKKPVCISVEESVQYTLTDRIVKVIRRKRNSLQSELIYYYLHSICVSLSVKCYGTVQTLLHVKNTYQFDLFQHQYQCACRYKW